MNEIILKKNINDKIYKILFFISLIVISVQIAIFVPSVRFLLVLWCQKLFHKFMITEYGMNFFLSLNYSIFVCTLFVFCLLLFRNYIKDSLSFVVIALLYGFIFSNVLGIINGNVSLYYNEWDWGDLTINIIKGYSSSSVVETNYPPFAVLMFKFFNLFFNISEPNLSYSHNYLMTIFFLFFSISSFIGVFLLYEGTQKQKFIFAIISFITGPILFTLCRMNIVLFALPLTLFFVKFYDSKSNKLRELSYICIAIAANIKFYPIAFYGILLKNKKWRELVRCFIYVVLFFAFPVCLDAISKQTYSYSQIEYSYNVSGEIKENSNYQNETLIDSILKLTNVIESFVQRGGNLKTALGYTNTHSFKGIVYRLLFFKSIFSDFFVNCVLNILLVLFVVLCMFVFIKLKKNYQNFTLLGLLCIFIPTWSPYYAAILLLPAFCLCVSKTDKDIFDYINLILFVAIFIYLNIPQNKLFFPSSSWHYVCLFFSLFAEICWNSYLKLKNIKNN